MRFFLSGLFFIVMLSSCSESDEKTSSAANSPNLIADSASENQSRWYTQAQLLHGTEVFAENCAVCHGDKAQGLTDNWRQRLPDGSFPPPPLNGTAHAWHHPMVQLTSTIETGGKPYGGQMPPFADKLNDDEKLAVIAYFQSFWDEEIYLNWLDMGGLD